MSDTILLAVFSQYVLGIGMSITAVFLILVVLVQRGRGGGLSGALGGMGGQSAFGTKAGDTFTRITIGIAVFWILLCIGAVKILGPSQGTFGSSNGSSAPRLVPPPDLEEQPAGKAPAGGPADSPAQTSNGTPATPSPAPSSQPASDQEK
jgi:preprotein translocase subunit SecG